MKNVAKTVCMILAVLPLVACNNHEASEAAGIPQEESTVMSEETTKETAETSSLALSESNASGMTAERAISLAERCVENKDDISAVQFYSYAISQQPDNAALYMARGECHDRIVARNQLDALLACDTSSMYPDIDEAVRLLSIPSVRMETAANVYEIWYAQEDYIKAAELGNEEAKRKLEELTKDRTVLASWWEADDGPNSGDFDCYGYNEYGSFVKYSGSQDAVDYTEHFGTMKIDISELEAKAANIEAGQTTDTTAKAELTYDAQGRCTRVDWSDGSGVEYRYTEKGQPEFVTEYNVDGEMGSNTKYVYNADGTVAMKISNWIRQKSSGTATFSEYSQWITQYEYTMLSKAQSSGDIWPDRTEIQERIEEKKTESLNYLVVLPETTPPQTVLPYTERPGWTTTAEHRLVLRAAPDENAEKLATIPLDSQVLEIGKTDSALGWVFTWYRGQYGWVNAQYLKGGEIFVPEWR